MTPGTLNCQAEENASASASDGRIASDGQKEPISSGNPETSGGCPGGDMVCVSITSAPLLKIVSFD